MKYSTHFKLLLTLLFACTTAFAQTDGTLDSTFGGRDGYVTNSISGVSFCGNTDERAFSIAVQGDGKIVVGGYCGVISSTSNGAFAIARYNADGTPDNTFGGGNGYVTNSISGGTGTDDKAFSIAIQNDGKIVAGGYSKDASGRYAFAIARYNADGTLDTSFNHTGAVRTVIQGGTGTHDQANSIAIQRDGKIVAGGYSAGSSGYHAFAIARYNTDGTLDSTFATNGTARTSISPKYDEINSIAIQSDGKIVAGGSSGPHQMAIAYAEFAIARYDTDGTLDGTFGGGLGSVRNYIPGSESKDDEANSIAIQSDGKIVAGGFSRNGSGYPQFAIARYNTDGSVDGSFGTNGSARNSISGGGGKDDRAYSIAIQSDGKIVAGGASNTVYALAMARYNTDGSLDSTFGVNGSASNPICSWSPSTTIDEDNWTDAYMLEGDVIYSISVQPDGKIVAGGYTLALTLYPHDTPSVFWNAEAIILRYIGASAADVSLAVQATDIVAKADVGSVTLSWKTQSEVNNAGFNILRQNPGAATFNLIASYTGNGALKGLGTSTSGRNYSFTDSKVKSGASYQYKIQSITTGGVTNDLTTLQATVGLPKDYALYQNYPNPFNPSTTIRFDLKQTSTVTLEVYNVLGQRVVEQNFGLMDAGRYNEVVSMDRFASGVYYYRISAVGNDGQRFVSVKKAVLMK